MFYCALDMSVVSLCKAKQWYPMALGNLQQRIFGRGQQQVPLLSSMDAYERSQLADALKAGESSRWSSFRVTVHSGCNAPTYNIYNFNDLQMTS